MKPCLFPLTRHCPVCKENLSWLPKLACCPKCGYKPVPVIEEKPYDTQLTADQILQEYLKKHSSETTTASVDGHKDTCDMKEKCHDDQKECHCTCKGGNKLCAHCRIRKLCEDIFHSKSRNSIEIAAEDCGKCEQKDSDAYNICRSSSRDCRPYLARVFSELRDLYDIKDPKHKSFDFDARCEKELQIDNKRRSKSLETKGESEHLVPNPERQGHRLDQEKQEPQRKKSGRDTPIHKVKKTLDDPKEVKQKRKKNASGRPFSTEKEKTSNAIVKSKFDCKKTKT